MSAQPPTGIEVKTGFLPLMFLLFLCTPTVVINGYSYRVPWGSHYWELQPGYYQVRVFYPYLFLPEAGANEINVEVRPGQVTRIDYYMGIPWVFAKGSIRQV
jgi:hypothetical protein